MALRDSEVAALKSARAMAASALQEVSMLRRQHMLDEMSSCIKHNVLLGLITELKGDAEAEICALTGDANEKLLEFKKGKAFQDLNIVVATLVKGERSRCLQVWKLNVKKSYQETAAIAEASVKIAEKAMKMSGMKSIQRSFARIMTNGIAEGLYCWKSRALNDRHMALHTYGVLGDLQKEES